jgi:hypothetical protein
VRINDELLKRKVMAPVWRTEINIRKGDPLKVTGCGGPSVCETSRLPHSVDSRFADGGDVSLTRRPPFGSNKIPGTEVC